MTPKLLTFIMVLAPAPAVPGTVSTTKPKFQPVVPTLRISGDTKGDSAFKAGVDITRGAKNPRNFHTFVPQLEATLKNGSGNLFSRDKDGARSQGFTLGLVYSHHHTASFDDPEREAWEDRIHGEAVVKCRARCGEKPVKEDADFCDAVEEADEGFKKLKNELEKLREAKLRELRDLEADALRSVQEPDASGGATSVLRLQVATAVRLRAEDGLFPGTPEYDDLKKLQDEVKKKRESVKKDPAAGMSLDVSRLCPIGQNHVEKESEPEDVSITDRSVHLGVRGGPTALKYMGGEFDADGVEQGPYSEQKKTRGAFLLAISAHKLLGKTRLARGTIEGFLGAGQVWEPGQDKIKWCAPVGDVTIDEDTSYPGEVCNEGTFKRPTRGRFVGFGGYFGAVDRARGLWRVAVGGTFSWKNLSALGANVPTKTITTLGVEIPIYLNILAIPSSKDVKSIEYRGLVRLVPRAEFMFDSTTNKWNSGFLLTLQLLGQRLLFGNALDWF